MREYADVPMSFVDGCLVRLAEGYADSVVVTTDGDFHVYRQHERQRIPLVHPDADRLEGRPT